MSSRTTTFQRLIPAMIILLGCIPTGILHGLVPSVLSYLGALIGPAAAYAQTPCITHVYEVLSVREDEDPYNDNCPSNDCTATVYVRTFEDGVEVSFENANVPEPIQWENCYTIGCNQDDPFSCVVGEYHPCASPACTSYMVDCGKQGIIDWWNDSYAPAHGLPPIGQETQECDPEPAEDNDDVCAQTGAPIDVTSGNMYHEERDIELKIPGMGLNFSRFYNSKSTRLGPMGYGWTHNYEIVMEDAGGSKKRVNGPKGKGVTFRQYSADYPAWGYEDRYFYAKFGHKKTQMSWDPDLEQYGWVHKDGRTFVLDVQGKAVQVQDGKGNWLDFSYDLGTGRLESVTDNFGRSLVFTYYGDGKLETVTDPAGHTVTYHYTGDNLTGVDYPDGRYKTYKYEDPTDPHNLTAILFGQEGSGPTQIEYEWTYDGQDRAVSSSKAGGNEQITLNYLSETQTELTNSLGATTTYTFERIQGRLKITDVSGPGCPSCGAGSDMQYEYDENQNLISSTDAEGNVTAFQDHDAYGQPWTVIEAQGSGQERTIGYTYHPYLPGVMTLRAVDSVLQPGGVAMTVYDYDDPSAPGDDPNVPNEDPTNLLYRYIRAGYKKSVSTDAIIGIQYITRYEYNQYGQVTRIDGPRTDVSDVTTFTYDAVTGDLLTKTEPLAGTTTYSGYDANGNVGSVTDINGNVTQYTYDERNRVKTVTQVGAGPSGEDLTTEYFYETLTGRLDYIRLPRGNYVDYDYDEAGRLTRIVKTAAEPQQGEVSAGEAIRYEYDTEGNKLREEYIDPQGTVVKFTDFLYDAYNRLEKEYNPEYGPPESNPYYKLYAYDGTGFRVSVTDERGFQTEYLPDSLRRLVQVTHHFENADGTVTDDYLTQYGYDGQDNLASIQDANGNTSTYQYDDFGNLLDAVSPDTGTTAYRYKGVNNLVKKTLADGTVVQYSYDALNRLTYVDFPDDAQNIAYVYDDPGSENGMGRLSRLQDPSGTTVFHYNKLGKIAREVKTIDGTDYEVSYGYDANGNLVSVTYPDGRIVTYTIDAYDRAGSVSQALNGYVSDVVTQARHLPNGPLELVEFPGAVPSWDPQYGVRYQMEALTASGLLERTYGFDPAGNITSITDNLVPADSMSFGYDSLGRLEEADGPWGTGGGYSYDPVGNRLSKDIGGLTTYTYVPGTNKLATASGAEPAAFSYDANGNMTGDGTLTYLYSQNQRLVQVLEGSSPVGEYLYDGQGKRVKKTAGGLTTVFIYDWQGRTLAEIHKGAGPGGQDVHQDYLWLEGLRVAMVVGEVGQRCNDQDGDGFGDPASSVCTYPYWDCDDDPGDDPPQCSSCTCGTQDCAACARCINPHPSTQEFSGDGIDSNCDGQDDPAGCFIATVAFGSPLAGQVAAFRHFRDRYLAPWGPGRALVRAYYSLGPALAGFIQEQPALKRLIRTGLYPLAGACGIVLQWGLLRTGAVFLVTLLVPLGIIFLVSRLTGRGILEYKKALCLLLAVVFSFDTVMLGYLGAGGGVREVQAAVPDGIYFYMNDHLGTPLKMVDEDGAVVWSADYLPFGLAQVDPASTVTNPWRFPGQYEDAESGLHYNLLRTYSPSFATFLEIDPTLTKNERFPYNPPHVLHEPPRLHPYVYSLNNPLFNIDSYGLAPGPCCYVQKGIVDSCCIHWGPKTLDLTCLAKCISDLFPQFLIGGLTGWGMIRLGFGSLGAILFPILGLALIEFCILPCYACPMTQVIS